MSPPPFFRFSELRSFSQWRHSWTGLSSDNCSTLPVGQVFHLWRCSPLQRIKFLGCLTTSAERERKTRAGPGWGRQGMNWYFQTNKLKSWHREVIQPKVNQSIRIWYSSSSSSPQSLSGWVRSRGSPATLEVAEDIQEGIVQHQVRRATPWARC